MVLSDDKIADGNNENKEEKGVWKPLRYEPHSCEYVPCIHRFYRKYPKPKPPTRIRYIYLPLSHRVNDMAFPGLRRLLALWLDHFHVLSQEKRDWLLEILRKNGYSLEDLEQLKQEALRRAELRRLKAAGLDEDDYGQRRKGSKKKSIMSRDKEQALFGEEDDIEGMMKGGVQGDDDGEGRGKKGKGEDGGKGKTEGEEGGKGKTEGEEGGKGKKKGGKKGKKGGKGGGGGGGGAGDGIFKKGKPGQLPAGWPHSIGLSFLVNFWTTLGGQPDEVFLSRAKEYFDIEAGILLETVCRVLDIPTPTESGRPTIIDIKIVIGCLNAVVWIATNIIAPAQAIKDEEVEKLLDRNIGKEETVEKGKKGKKGKSKGKNKKGKKGKPKKIEEPEQKAEIVRYVEEEPARTWEEMSFPLILCRKNHLFGDNGSISARGSLISPDDPTTRFMQRTKYYDPNCPEFIYGGPRNPTPEVSFGTGTWSTPDAGKNTLSPESSLPYYPGLRPLLLALSEEDSSTDESSTWYLMSDPSYYEPEVCRWEDATTVEQLEMVGNIFVTMATMPGLSNNAFVEMVAELCEAIDLAEIDESATAAERMLDAKRTVVVEQLFLSFFGASCRDYNEDMVVCMRTVCRRVSTLVRYLLQVTARTLWQYQSSAEIESTSEPSEGQSVADPKDLAAWNEWIEWLNNALKDSSKFAAWLQDQGKYVMDMSTNPNYRDFSAWLNGSKEEFDLWISKKADYLEASKYYGDRVVTIRPVNGRPVTENLIYGKWQTSPEPTELPEEDLSLMGEGLEE